MNVIDKKYAESAGKRVKAMEKQSKETAMIPNKDENPNGLYNRYIVEKRNGVTDPNAEYFVLRLDEGGSDPDHILACRKAVMTYADEIEPHIPQLAADLRARYSPD